MTLNLTAPEEPTHRQAHGPAGFRRIRLTDFEQLSSVFANWQGRFDQLSSGRFQGVLRVVRGGSVRVIEVEANQRVMLRGRDAAGLMSFHPVIAGNAESSWQRRRLTAGQLVAHGTEVETLHCSARRTHHLGMSVPHEVLMEAARWLQGTDETILSRNWEAYSPPPRVFEKFHRNLSRLLTLGCADSLWLQSAEGLELEQECLRSLVAAIGSTALPARLSLPARSQLLQRAEEYMRSRLTEPMGAVDLCRDLGVSDRTLRLAFRERFGIGPMVYYKYLRLNAVRSKLKSNPLQPIAATARECGFHHLGNFAADYRRLFGERPSATVR